MRLNTKPYGRWLIALLMIVGVSSSAFAQRTVKLTLNTATIPDTTNISSFIEVRGQANGTAPATLADGNMIDWSDVSTLEPTNIGGDYWEIEFQIADTTDLTFKFFSGQSAATGLIDGWEVDPNPTIPPGTGDTTLTVHFFEFNGEYKDQATGDKGSYDWRPYEQKEDSIAVWYRVFMNTQSGVDGGYERANTDLTIGVRGDPLGGTGPLNWDGAHALTPESGNNLIAGYHLYSGVAYYPASLAGTEQPYKFVIEKGDGSVSWEAIDNRTFVVPANDTTLYRQFFNNSPAVSSDAVQVTADLLFTVDLQPLVDIGMFDRGRGDTLQVRGSFNSWGDCDPELCSLQRVGGTDEFEQAVTTTAFVGTSQAYKFYIEYNDAEFAAAFNGATPPSGWEEPISTTGADRTFEFQNDVVQDQGVKRFNDVLVGNIVPAGTEIDITFQVTMEEAIANMADPFEAASDTVTLDLTGDAIWAFTQGIPRNTDGGFTINASVVQLTDADQDGVYSGVLKLVGPTYAAIQYKFAYGGDGTYTAEGGGTTSGLGRRRTRYVTPNADGSWPTEWTFDVEAFQPAGNLPFDENPVSTGVENIGGELPTQIELEHNYPNPFNPVTTIEYAINTSERVSLKVFDLTGRLVATLVDGIQPASTYRVTFDANDLASGVYIYRLEAANTTITKKMILLK